MHPRRNLRHALQRPRRRRPHRAARPAARGGNSDPERGRSLLCNGAVVFDGTGDLLLAGRTVPSPG
ncbi:DUF5999 family protein [Streptomyces sp. NPDC017991]|uniref:DUF5999 family protein n=1 Tax=Streptomyces sp. NPDC017991 TaxID=3365026 RepID=UPI0037A7CB09